MSHHPPNDSAVKKATEEVTDKELEEFRALMDKDLDQADLDAISEMVAIFVPSHKRSKRRPEKRSNKQTNSAEKTTEDSCGHKNI
ncbi:hypothetical protein DM02DRAFT_620530 [Periconia macrospinosa]|uniref:Uncharacterized protein n=1 Tax=Periconia macrospinosa TaxID=97972 RepID=A0A2V1D2E4_9PLEO|nr:hypothetical protein DM02DRAFT_620530 [Periconia macrospinosa]